MITIDFRGLRTARAPLFALVLGCFLLAGPVLAPSTSQAEEATPPAVSADAEAQPEEPARPPSRGLSQIARTNVVRIGMSGEQPPLTMTGRDGQLFGLDVALARVLAKSMGVEAELVQMPFNQLLPALEAGDLELVMSGVTITPARSQRVEFVGPYYTSGKTVLSKEADLTAATGPEALNSPKLTIATLAGSTSEEYVKTAMPKAKLVPVESLDAAIAKVIANEVDALVAERETCAYAVLRNPDHALLASETALTVEPMGIAVQAGDPRFVRLIQIYLDALRERGVVERARDFWLKDPSWVKGLK